MSVATRVSGREFGRENTHGQQPTLLLDRAVADDFERRYLLPDMRTSTAKAPTQLLDVGAQHFAYRRFGEGSGSPILCLQHFIGTLDNWDPAVIDPLAAEREVILFDIGIKTCDVLGYSLGGS
jgi:hypothetical protein